MAKIGGNYLVGGSSHGAFWHGGALKQTVKPPPVPTSAGAVGIRKPQESFFTRGTHVGKAVKGPKGV